MSWHCSKCKAKFSSKCVAERTVLYKDKKKGTNVLYVSTSIEWFDPSSVGSAHQTVKIELSCVKDYEELQERLTLMATNPELLPVLACEHDYVLEDKDCELECGKEGMPHKRVIKRDASPERDTITIE